MQHLGFHQCPLNKPFIMLRGKGPAHIQLVSVLDVVGDETALVRYRDTSMYPKFMSDILLRYSDQ